LAISVNAGAQTLGPLLQITKVMSQKQLSLDWTPKEELPVSVYYTTALPPYLTKLRVPNTSTCDKVHYRF